MLMPAIVDIDIITFAYATFSYFTYMKCLSHALFPFFDIRIATSAPLESIYYADAPFL